MKPVAAGMFALLFGFTGAVALVWGVRVAFPAVETCWHDPRPERALDFDFYTGIEGRPNRCGYLPGKSVLPEVMGQQGMDRDLACYPLERIECPGATP